MLILQRTHTGLHHMVSLKYNKCMSIKNSFYILSRKKKMVCAYMKYTKLFLVYNTSTV